MWDESDDDAAPPPRSSRGHSSPLDLPLRGDESGRVPKRSTASLFPDWEGASAQRRRADPPTAASPAPPRALPVAPVAPSVRFLAGLADLGMAAAALAILWLSLRHLAGPPPAEARTFVLLFALELTIVGGALALFLFGTTPGMALAGLMCVESDGTPTRLWRAFTRTLFALALWPLSMPLALIRADRRSLTDIATGTRLVER